MKPITTTTHGFDGNVSWEPFIDGPRVGYKVTRLSDREVSYIYMNPSTSGMGRPDVFVYSGTSNDTELDYTECFVSPFFRSPE